LQTEFACRFLTDIGCDSADAPFSELELKNMIVEFWALIMDASVWLRVSVKPDVFQSASCFVT
jgi:hypothetical protein